MFYTFPAHEKQIDLERVVNYIGNCVANGTAVAKLKQFSNKPPTRWPCSNSSACHNAYIYKSTAVRDRSTRSHSYKN